MLKIILYLLSFIIQLYLMLYYELDNFHCCLTFFNIVASVIFIKVIYYKGILNIIASLFVYVYILFSTHVSSILKIPSSGLRNILFLEKDFLLLANFGVELLSIYFIGFFLFFSFKKSELIKINTFNGRIIPKSLFYLVIIFAFLISLICGILGVGRMGGDLVVLPFHLTGILNVIRLNLIPVLIMIYIYDLLSNNIKVENKIYVLIFLWGLLETFVRLSKSALITSLLPTLIVMILIGYLDRKKLFKVIGPLILIFLFLYPIIGVMRSEDNVSVNSFVNSYETVKSSKTEDNSSAYTRIFMTGSKYLNALPVLNQNDYFDFSKAPLIITMGGSASYTTYVIDGYALGVRHSSGTTGIIDAFLFGGKGFCFFMILVFSLIASFIDCSFMIKYPLIRILSLLIFVDFVMKKSISMFIDALVLPYFIINILEFIIIFIYIKKRKANDLYFYP